MMGLVGPDGKDHVPHHGLFRELPILDRQLRRRQLRPHRQPAPVDLLQDVSVGDDSLLFQISNKSKHKNTGLCPS